MVDFAFNRCMNVLQQIRLQNLLALIEEVGGQTALAEKIERSKVQVNNLCRGKRAMGDTLARAIEKYCGKPEGWMDQDHTRPSNVIAFRDTKANDRIVVIPRLSVTASMGNGLLAPEGYVDIVENMSVNRDYLSRTVSYTSTSNLAVITGFGDSMEGTYNDGDLLLVDRGVKEIKLDAVYVVRYHDDIYIKRFQRRPGKPLLMISDNKKYEPVEITPAAPTDFEVLGRVLMAWNAKKL